MFKLVIWIDLNAQSVCTYQLWIFLILWCSTSWEDSRDYKFIIFGHLIQKIWNYQVNRRFDSIMKIDSNWTHKIWSFIVLPDSTFSKDSNEILIVKIRLRNWKIWILIRNHFNSEGVTWHVLIRGYRFVWIGNKKCRIKLIWTDQIDRTGSVKWICPIHWIPIGRLWFKEEELT
jgi:hypothetical protein